MHRVFTIIFCIGFLVGRTQTLGGSSAYNFLKLPSTPLLTAAGGVNTSYKTNEVSLSANNPALLSADLHTQLGLSFNSFLAGIKTYSLTTAYQKDNLNTTFGGHIYFVDYGSIPNTDAAGNVSGNFHPVDYVVQVSAERKYLERWNYGASIKFINSNYQLYKSSAIAFDFALLYSDSSKQLCVSALAKNMGFQLKTYVGEAEDLPFDLQIGITKRLAKAPFGFSVTAQHLHQFNIVYNDDSFNADNNFSSNNNLFNKLFNHLVIASHIYIGNNLEATLGYNHLRRQELNIGSSGNGLNGFSMGVKINFAKLQVLYARSSYQRNVSYNQLGLTLKMDRFFVGGL
ncbi:MAG TPA: type IX secretion system protein PorQ [Flavisolibacter sp.]|nr:type IX secretion system protein PorQ [Flavisolibacter sp.]